MAKFTKEQVQELDKYVDIMKDIVINHASSFVTLQYRELINKMYKYLGYSQSCSTCNTALYLTTSTVYNQYLQSKVEYEEEERRNSSGSGATETTERNEQEQSSKKGRGSKKNT